MLGERSRDIIIYFNNVVLVHADNISMAFLHTHIPAVSFNNNIQLDGLLIFSLEY